MASIPIGTINCLLCGGTQIYPGPRYQNHLIQEHGVVHDIEFLIKVSIYKSDHNGHLPNFIDRSQSRSFAPSSTPHWTYWLQILSKLCFQRVAFSGNFEILVFVVTKTLFLITLIIKLTLGNIFIKVKNPPGGATVRSGN